MIKLVITIFFLFITLLNPFAIYAAPGDEKPVGEDCFGGYVFSDTIGCLTFPNGLFNQDNNPNADPVNAINLTILAIGLFSVVIIIAAVFFIIRGAIDISRSEGNEKTLGSGRSSIRNAVFGLIIGFLLFVALNIVALAIFGEDFFSVAGLFLDKLRDLLTF